MTLGLKDFPKYIIFTKNFVKYTTNTDSLWSYIKSSKTYYIKEIK